MATKKKMLQAAAGNAGGTSLDITDVFSTYLYEANSTARSITNGIDLAGEGGLAWLKSRSSTREHALYDTERGVEKLLKSNSTGAQQNTSGGLTAFNSDGFSLGTYADVNGTSYGDFSSWTWRKAPKFFDVVTWTGNGTAGRTVSHNLGAVPGTIIVKVTSITEPWAIYHRKMNGGVAPQNYYMRFTTGAEAADSDIWNNTAPTSSVFTVGGNDKVNANNQTYVAYLFAHNDGDGEFGPDADQDIIKCGSFSLNGSYEADVNLGFEPQWLMIKPAEDAASWTIFDTMRGATVNGDAAWLAPDLTQAEANTANRFWPTATGFHIGNYGITAGNDIIYMAIRRGPLAPPTAATEVFAIDEGDGVGAVSAYTSGFPVDFAIDRTAGSSSPNYVATRLLQGKRLQTDGTNAEASESAYYFDYMEGWRKFSRAAGNYSWMWKRAPSYFDCVAYTGNGVNGRTLSHNLGAPPEMMWVKSRGNAEDWYVYHKDLGNGSIVILNASAGVYNGMSNVWNNTSPTSSVFTVGTNGKVNLSGDTYIAYLFATLAGVSKVGSYTGTGAAQNIDCGFTSGARFILLKKTSASGHWYLFDSTRGIVAGNDPYLYGNGTAAQVTSRDAVDPLSSGFALTTDTTFNASGATYIFYAIA